MTKSITVAAVLLAAVVPSADARHWTANSIIRHAHGNPYRCDVARPGVWSVAQNRCVIFTVFRKRWLAKQADRVAFCESRWDNNDGPAVGLFQFLPSTWAWTPYRTKNPRNPIWNARAARWLHDLIHGWSSPGGWAASESCHGYR